MKFRHRAALLALSLFAMFATASLGGADKPITIALVPDGLSAPERMPLQNYLARQMGRDVKLVVPNSYVETMDGLGNGSIDFALLGAVTYVRARAKLGVIPLVQRTSDQQFHAVFIAGASTNIHSLRDLKGKKFAFGDINSTSGHVIPYLEMKHAGLNVGTDLETRYSGGHSVTAKFVESGVVDAGALDESVFNSMLSGGKLDRTKVRAFYTSRPFVDYCWAARKGASDADRQKFTEAFLDLREGRDDDVLKIVRGTKFIKVGDDEYASIRQLVRELNLMEVALK